MNYLLIRYLCAMEFNNAKASPFVLKPGNEFPTTINKVTNLANT